MLGKEIGKITVYDDEGNAVHVMTIPNNHKLQVELYSKTGIVTKSTQYDVEILSETAGAIKKKKSFLRINKRA